MVFTIEDVNFANKVRKTHKPIILLVNKSEAGDRRTQATKMILYKLGLGDPIYISAMHGTGLENLYTRIVIYYPIMK